MGYEGKALNKAALSLEGCAGGFCWDDGGCGPPIYSHSNGENMGEHDGKLLDLFCSQFSVKTMYCKISNLGKPQKFGWLKTESIQLICAFPGYWNVLNFDPQPHLFRSLPFLWVRNFTLLDENALHCRRNPISLIKSIVSDSKQMQFADQNPSSISHQYPHWIPNVGWFYSPLAAPRSCHRRRNLSAGCRAAERCRSWFRRRRGWRRRFFQVGMAWFMGLSWHFCMGWLGEKNRWDCDDGPTALFMKRWNYEIFLQETQEKGPQTIGQLGFFLVVARLRDGWVCPDMGRLWGILPTKLWG